MSDNQSIFWDKVSNDVEFENPSYLEEFKKYVPLDAKILDFGCGYGRVMKELMDHKYKNVYGLEFSALMIERANQYFPKLNIQLADISKVDVFENEIFDAVILFDVLTCNYSDEEINSILKFISMHLKENGILYVCDFLLMNDERNLERYKKYQSKYEIYGVFEINGGGVLRHFNENEFKKYFQGYRLLWECQYNHPSMRGNDTRRIRLILEKK